MSELRQRTRMNQSQLLRVVKLKRLILYLLNNWRTLFINSCNVFFNVGVSREEPRPSFQNLTHRIEK